VIASGPFYASGTFWAVALFVVAVATLVFTYALWRAGNPRREIVYSTPVVAALLSGAGRVAGDKIAVTVNGKAVLAPYLVELLIESRSRRDIRSADFDQGKPLVFEVIASCAELTDMRGQVDTGNVHVDGGEITIAPCLIRKGIIARMQFMTDGKPDVRYHSPLVDVSVRESSYEPRAVLGKSGPVIEMSRSEFSVRQFYLMVLAAVFSVIIITILYLLSH
jgi:hypothetical protein